jgi:hypothetical protein
MADIIVAGNTSGAITISAPLVAGSGVLTLPTGTDTLIGKATTDTLTNKSIAASQLTGTIAASALPAGSVLQVVQGSYSTTVTTAASSYIDSGLTASITPTRNTSKILVLVSQNGVAANTSTAGVNIQLLRGASVVSIFAIAHAYAISTNNQGTPFNYLDSPATTSSTTYKTQFKNYGVGNAYVQGNSDVSTITLMEIAV